jgi:hypothetical protein
MERAYSNGNRAWLDGCATRHYLAQRVGNYKLFADSYCGRVLNLTMSRYSVVELCRRAARSCAHPDSEGLPVQPLLGRDL